MKIAIIVEGKTEEKAFMPVLRTFLKSRLQQLPDLDPKPQGGRIPTGDKLKRVVDNLLQDGFDAVIALTDVYTGTKDFKDAADAKAKMKTWVGNNPKFYPHVAQHDFEAWLLPFWDRIQELAKYKKSPPSGKPEQVNHDKPPSKHIQEIFELGKCRDSYSKTRDAPRILKDQDLMKAVNECPELKAFVNTILLLCNGDLIP
ncbi:MAG: DUF4276 family protein [Microcoleus sp.]